MGRYTSLIAFIIFMVGQFIQGVILDTFLEQETNDSRQWYWLIVDGGLLVFWSFLAMQRRTRLVSLDLPFVPIPTLAASWGLYLALLFIPRVLWIMVTAGTCLGQSASNGSDSSVGIEGHSVFKSVSSLAEWEGNSLTILLAIGTNFMLLVLALAGYGQHGLLSTRSTLDFDMAEAAFSLIDGVEILSVFWEEDVILACPFPKGACWSNTSSDLPSSPTQQLDAYICALRGGFGGLVITIALCCFVLPFFALWRFKRHSTVLKAKDTIRETSRKLSQLSLAEKAERETPSSGDIESGDDEVGRKHGTKQLSTYHLDMAALRSNVRTHERMLKEITVFRALYILWDLVLVNMAGAVLRFILWFQFDRAVSVLITKNVLAMIFRIMNIVNDLAVPWYKKKYGTTHVRKIKKTVHSTSIYKRFQKHQSSAKINGRRSGLATQKTRRRGTGTVPASSRYATQTLATPALRHDQAKTRQGKSPLPPRSKQPQKSASGSKLSQPRREGDGSSAAMKKKKIGKSLHDRRENKANVARTRRDGYAVGYYSKGAESSGQSVGFSRENKVAAAMSRGAEPQRRNDSSATVIDNVKAFYQ